MRKLIDIFKAPARSEKSNRNAARNGPAFLLDFRKMYYYTSIHLLESSFYFYTVRLAELGVDWFLHKNVDQFLADGSFLNQQLLVLVESIKT